MVRRSIGLVAAILLMAVLVPGSGASAGPSGKASRSVDTGTRHLSPDSKQPRVRLREARRLAQRLNPSAGAQQVAAVGEQRLWPAIDDFLGELYVKLHTLRGVGEHIEVWVASDMDDVSTGTDFPEGDCRNGVRTQITDEQVQYLIDQFDGNIYPKESEVFSVPPDRDGTDAPLAVDLELPPDYYQGDGDDIVVLVDNVRDDNFYDTNNENTFPYVAGFFTSFYNEILNRNVMTIDAWDWLHRTGANPPHEPSSDPCTSAEARPFLYEGVFAHEYQHLLEYYEDDGEPTWVNEGLSDWAMLLTGYADWSIPVTELGFESAVQCFLGHLITQTEFNPIPDEGGPENSLTLWGDQTDFPSEALCDYGATDVMMALLADRFGPEFMGELHRNDLHGFEGVQALLQAAGSDLSINELVDTWAALAALDGILDDGATLHGAEGSDFQVSTLDATINWDNDQAFSSPGAPPNGSDYVRLRNGSGFLSAGRIHRIGFAGASELPTLPIEWTVDPEPPGQPGDPALFSGTGDNLDRSIVREIAVPSGSPQLTFEADWSLEDGFDYSYVQLSTDGGETYFTIPCSDQAEGPLGSAFNGVSGGFLNVSCDLSTWAGQSVVLAFRLVTDGSFFLDGFWLDDVTLDGTLLSDGSTLDGWSSPTEFNPVDVDGYTVRLVAYDEPGDHRHGHGQGQRAWTATIPLNDDFDGRLRGRRLRMAIGWRADVVAAIVTFHDPTEDVLQYAPYSLWVNGVLQPGG
jgi:immune inhibitor InhA-like protein